MPPLSPDTLVPWLRLAGIAQLLIVASGACVPAILRWREQTRALRPLTRQIFWTYGGYILGSNLAFGLLALLLPRALLDGSPLAMAVNGFVLSWWLVRLVLQFTCYDRRDAPPGRLTRWGEVAIVALFVLLVVVYGRVLAASFGSG